MAKLNTQRLKSVVIDGEHVLAPEFASVSDVVPSDVKAVTVYDASGGSQLIPRSEFNRPLPDGFTTHLTHVEKGNGDTQEDRSIPAESKTAHLSTWKESQ